MHDGLILAIGGTTAAVIGSIDNRYAKWASRTMLATNLLVIGLSLFAHLMR